MMKHAIFLLLLIPLSTQAQKKIEIDTESSIYKKTTFKKPGTYSIELVNYDSNKSYDIEINREYHQYQPLSIPKTDSKSGPIRVSYHASKVIDTITLSQNQDVSIKIDVFKTESDSTKKSTTIKEKTYNYIYKTERKGSWQTTFGFNFIHLRNNDTYFSKTVDSTFVIAEGTNQNKYDFYPTIMFTWYANDSDTINFGLSGGLGYDLKKSVSVFVGGSIIYNQNITITAGLAFHNQQRLNSAYQEGDLIKENLSFEQLHEDYIRLNPFLSIAFRLDKSPFN